MTAARDTEENVARDTEENTERDHREYASRGTLKKRLLRSVAVQAAMLSAAAHLLWAWPRLSDPSDPRPYVFLLGGIFTVIVAVATLHADEYRRLYALGAGTLFSFLAGYVGWHGGGVAAALASEPLAIVAKGAELGGVVTFLALYRIAPPTSVVVDRQKQDDGGEADDDEASDGDEAGSDEASNA